MDTKIKVFCQQQLHDALEQCRKLALDIASVCPSPDEDMINMMMTSLFCDRYYLTEQMKQLVGEDDALCMILEEI